MRGEGATAGWGAALRALPERAVGLELRRAVLWLPVLMAGGIAVYFGLPAEPDAWTAMLWILPAVTFGAAPGLRGSLVARAALLGAAAAGIGFGAALLSARLAEAPQLGWPVAATVEGRVAALDRADSGAPRVLLERVTMFGHAAAETPGRVRVTLLDTPLDAAPRPGEWVHVHATLLPPGLPVEPGGFDFAKRAWFEGLGAVGYARTRALRVPVEEAVGAGGGDGWGETARLALADARLRLADGIRAALPGDEGAFAAAIIVGDRAAIGEEANEALRVSSLAHLLAISGLHMGILTGLVFAAMRLGLAAVPAVSLRLPVKKIAAAVALAAGAGYLMLSGATVATQRAFVMVAVVFVAVMLDRPAISLRALALAATIILAVRPISLLDAGFQMSFAATVALVAGYEELRRRQRARGPEAAARREARGWAARAGRLVAIYIGGVLFTSLLAGTATAPYSGFHFNRVAPYGLLANLAAVPVMGVWIAPAAIVAGLAAPFGLAEPALDVMGAGIAWVLIVARGVTALPGADMPLAAAPGAALVLLSLGGLWTAIWRGPWRLLGALPVLAALALWQEGPAQRPVLLVSPGGGLIGLLGPEGRALDRDRADGYAAETWLRRDGDGADQVEAAARPGLLRGRGRAEGDLGQGWRVVALSGRGAAEAAAADCGERTVVIARTVEARPEGGCLFLGRRELDRLGAVGIWMTGEGPRLLGSRPSGTRPWHPRGEAQR